MHTKAKSSQHDELVPDPQVIREFGVTSMSLWRWDHNDALIQAGWPAPIRIRGRKFRSRLALEEFKRTMARRALEERNSPPSRPRPRPQARKQREGRQ